MKLIPRGKQGVTKRNKAQELEARCFALLHSLRPSAAVAGRSANLRCQTPLGANASENRAHRYVDWVLAVEAQRVEDSERRATFQTLFWVALKAAGVDPAYGFFEKNRLIEEYNGCTFSHLPDRICSPPFPMKEDASLAIFAARMAFSSLVTRSWGR